MKASVENLERRQLLSTYYVNDTWVEQVNSAPGGTIGVVEPGDIVMTAPGDFPAINNLVFDTQAFATIQTAANKFFVTGNDTLKVISGTYPQAVNLVDGGPGAHALPLDGLHIEGAQANVDARTRVGQPESIITTSSVNVTDSLFYIDPTVDGVVIDGFTFNGNGPASGGVLLLDGATDSNAARGILVDSNGVNIKNNIITNFYRRGVQYGFNAAPTGGTVSLNSFTRIGANDELPDFSRSGYAMLAFADASFINNNVTNTHNGSYHIQVYPPSTTPIVVSGNNISTRETGIALNETSTSAPLTTITNNIVTTTTAGGVGAILWTVGNPLTFTNNTFTTSAANTTGVQVWAGAAGVPVNVTVGGGSISGYTTGVQVSNEVNINGSLEPALASASVTVSGVTITPATGGTGVLVEDTATGSTNVSATLAAGTLINGSASGKGVLVTGALASFSGSNATIHGESIGIDVNAGSASITGMSFYDNATAIRLTNGGTATVNNNNFEGGANPDNGTDLRIDNSAGGITGGVLTGNTFAGINFYIDQRAVQNLTALRTPAGTNNYNVAGSPTTNDFIIEARVFHKPDAPATSGLVTWVSNSFFIVPVTLPDVPSAADNDYLRIKNAIEAASNGTTINLQGTFNWTEAFAAASWAKGNDGIAGNDDDYEIVVPGGLNNVTVTAPGGLGTARISNTGVGDIPTADLEGVFDFEGGPNASDDNQNWTISNLEIYDFDLSIGMFNSGAGSDAYSGTQIVNNHIIVASDLSTTAAPADSAQNIGIHFSFGAAQKILNNTIELHNDGVNDAGLTAANIGMQSNTSGGSVYEGLLIDGNTINVIGTQGANPAAILGIWENAHGHTSNITVSNNQFNNTGAGNNAATNLQRGFRVTSHSGASTTVTYSNNSVSGANIGFQWLSGSNFAGNQPVVLTGNTLSSVNTGYLVQSNGLANISGGSVTGNSGIGVDIAAGSSATISGVSFQNLSIGINVAGSASISNNNFNAGTDNSTDIKLLSSAGASTIGAGNLFGGNTFFIDNQSTNNFSLTTYSAANFEGNDPSTLAGSFTIENVMHHRIDTDLPLSNGLITWVSNNVYITTPGAGSTDSSIQRGIDAIAAGGHIVNVQAGTYAESLTVSKPVTLDGEGSNPSPLVTLTSNSSNPLVRITSTTSTDNVTIRDFAFNGTNGPNQAGEGVLSNASANYGTLTIDRSTFTNLSFDAVSINGDATNGISAHNVVISNSAFSNNGAGGNGGAGDISLFQYNGNASFSNLTLVGNSVGNTGERIGIQLRGVGAGNGVSEAPMGIVSFNNVNISGNYRTSFLGFQRYSTLTGLTLAGVSLGGATSNITGTFGALLRFDAVGSGTVSSPATVNLGNTRFGGTSGASAQKNDIEFAPDNTFAFLRADATGTIWNLAGTDVAAASLTEAQAYDVEDRILHYVDPLNGGQPYKGFAEIQNGQAFVTATVGPNNDGRIQRAVDVVDNGGTVHVKAGTYAEALTISRSVTIDGQGNGPVPLVTLTAASGSPIVRVTSTNAADNVTLVDIAFDGLNGATQAGEGVRVDAPANFDTLTVNRSTFTNFSFDAIALNGDSVNGLSLHNAVLSNLSFSNNGSAGGGGTGDISIFAYNGNAALSNLTLVGNSSGNTGEQIGIQFRGVGAGNGVSEKPMGTVSLSNIGISGNYVRSFLGIQRYSTVTGLSLNNVSLGGATSNVTGTFGDLFRFDAVGSGSVASPATVNLGNTHFRGVSPGSAQQTFLEFAPDNGFAFLRADATNTIWDLPSGSNLLASSMTIAQAYDAEDRILDYVKNLPAAGSFKGWAELQNGKAFVTDTVLGPISGDSISRAAEVVDSGGTVHIKSGTYTENVNTSTNNVTLSPGSSPGQVVINGNITLDGNDALLLEINGLTPGTQHDQFVINGTVTLGGATLNTTGSTITATQGQSLTIIANDSTDAVNGFFAAPANGNGNVVLVNGQPFFVFYTGADGNDVTLTRAPNGTPPGPQPAPTIVFVDDNWAGNSFGADTDGAGGGSLGNGTAKGYDQFDNIQDAINAVAAGGEIRIYGGTYTQNLVVGKSLRLLGEDFILSGTGPDGSNDVVIDPATTVTNVLEVNANNVEVAGVLIDGNTTDSRGIFITVVSGAITGIDIHHNTVRNLDRRGIQVDSYLASFDIHNNTVSNVVGSPDAIGIFNFGGGGLTGTAKIHDNIVTGSTGGIGGQQSAGMEVYNNNITMPAGGVGIQDSNPGTGAAPPLGAIESFTNNTITGGDGDSYGLIIINPAMNSLVQANNVTTPGTGMGVYGHFGTPVTTTFNNNTVAADTLGIEVSTDTFGFNGTQSVSAVLTNNEVSGSTGSGILLLDSDGAGAATAVATFSNNNVHNNFLGIDMNGGTATLTSNSFSNNTTAVRVRGGGNATLTSNSFTGDNVGLVVQNGSATFTNSHKIDGIAVGVGGLVTVSAGGTNLIVTTSLTITGNGKMDLNDNDMIVDYTGPSQRAAIQTLINAARAGGAWTGNGLTSTAAKNRVPKNTTLGVLEATEYKSIYGAGATFDGETIDNTAVLIKYTYYGDADFNGVVNFDDYSRIDAGFNFGRTGWLNGDFDGNGVVNFDDYSLIDLAFNTQTGPLRPASSTAPAAPVGQKLPGKTGG